MKYKLFEANEQLGFNFPFILIMPDKLKKHPKIYVEGANSVLYAQDGQQSLEAQIKFAKDYADYLTEPQDGRRFNAAYLMQQLNEPLLIPIIERCDFEHQGEFYTQMLGRNVVTTKEGKYANLSQQVLNMINYVKTGFNINFQEKNGLIGMSTSGVFAGRMLFLEPESFDVCLSICSNAVQPLPIPELFNNKLPYPLGTADYEQITGKKFNEEEYRKAQQLFIVGKQEDNSKYNIVNNPLLHDEEVQEWYKKLYGDVTLQERQEEIDYVFDELGYENVKCILAEGGHNFNYKGNLIMNFVRSLEDIDELKYGE